MKKTTKRILLAGCCLVALIVAAQLAGIRINTTNSYPPGIYLMTDAPIEKGSLVIFCPPDTPIFHEARARGYIGAGFCPGGNGYMIKKILAVQDDHVTVSASGVMVNGTMLPNSKPMVTDTKGRPLPHIKVDIPALGGHSVLLMSDYSPKSFDGRYFGLIDKTGVISSIRPLWTR